jgi:uncharacterized protein involved in outer membrane biogenesis
MNLRAWLGIKHLSEVVAKPRVRKTGWTLLGLFAVFICTAFFAGPPLLKSFLVNNLSKQLGRTVTVGAIHVNPFMLSVTIDNFMLAEANGKTPFISFDQAYVNAQLVSLVFGGPVISAIQLKAPRVHVVRAADGRYNFQDLVDRFSKPATPAPTQKTKSKPLRFSLNNIRISNGEIDFDDRAKGRMHTVRQINIAIPFLSDLFYRVDDYVQPAFSAVVNGAPLQLTGQSKPFEADRESSLQLKLSRLNLGEYLTYVPKDLKFTLPSGTLDADIKIAFLQPPDAAPVLRVSGTAAVRNLALNEAKDTPTLRLKRLDIALGSIEPLVKRFTVNRITASEAELFVRRDRTGRINLANLVAPDDNEEPLPYFLIGAATLSQATIHVRDEYRARPFETTLNDIRLAARNITSEKGQAGQIELSAAGPGDAAFKAATDVVLAPFALAKLTAELTQLRVPQPQGKGDMVRIGRLSVGGGAFDLERQSVSVDQVTLANSEFNIRRDRRGQLNLSELSDSEHAAHAPAVSSGAASPLQYAVKRVSVDDVGVHWHDEIPAGAPADIGIDKIQAQVEDISSAPKSAAKLSLTAQVAKRGKLAVNGSVVMAPLSAKLKLDARGLPILPLQPYFADEVHVTVTGGSIIARGSLDTQWAGTMRAQYRGMVQVNKFASVDNVDRNDFLKWETLHVGGLNVVSAPLNVAIGDIALTNFYSRLIINPDGSLNVQHVMGKEPGSKQAVAGETGEPVPPAEPVAPMPAVASATPKPAPTPIKIARITLQGGQVNFSDYFIQPNYSANLTQIGGSVTGLSSNLASTAAVELRGKVDDVAPVEILGKVNPLSGNLFLDLAASAKGVDLPAATPYSARYAGYPIIKGKLSMDVKYHIENRKLSAENHITLDQLTFGDKVESPTATKLPVLLAVALLRDRNGVIDINLPISGSLDDPKFSVGGIVLKVIVNLIVKAVTSPFALLGSLFGGGEQLAYIEFDYGRATLDKTAQEKIQSLTKALEERPGLKLDITGRVDPVADTEGLRRVSIERKVRQVKFDALSRQGAAPASLDEVKVEPEEYPKLLKEAYRREKFPKPRNLIGLAKDLPVPEMEKLMLTNAVVTDDDLRQLAIRRARAVADAIAKSGKVAADRVFVLEPKLKRDKEEKGPAAKAKLSRVDFSLK